MTIRVCVTKRDIECGERFSPGCCPVARAVARATGMTPNVGYAELILGGRWMPTPAKVRDFAVAFDACEAVRPITFDLELEEVA